MSAIVILEADIKEGQKEELLKLLSIYLPETRQYKGFINISIHIEHEMNHVLFYEKWQSFEDYESYLQWRTETGVMQILGATFSSPPLIRYFNTEDV
ncbi:MAG: antibiotic biosynthesis monooxygenase [Methylococcales bacterium]|nr:antibiotic biosynthesis monooxygenase [Methylococcales bacterium]